MISSVSFRGSVSAATGVYRLFIAAVGVVAVLFAVYRAPAWFDAWSPGAVAGGVGAAVVLLLLTIGVALRGSAPAVRRVAVEFAMLGGALVAAEATLLALAPHEWSDSPFVQQMASRERAAHAAGVDFDDRLRTEVTRELRAAGQDAVSSFLQDVIHHPDAMAAIRSRGILPLSNVSNALVVECNEGNGYLQFKTGEHGFNNAPGLVDGAVDVAVIGESFALGHCVPPSASAVARVRNEFPRTANFGIAGSRVLSQLGVFREYVEPLEPRVVVWFVNVNFAEARQEANQPVLVRYLDDPQFSQHLLQRQAEVDSFLREVVAPLNEQRDTATRRELAAGTPFPWGRFLQLATLRSMADFAGVQRAPPPPDMTDFQRALDRMVEATHRWAGEVIVVILPSYELSTQRSQNVARYHAMLASLDPSRVGIVDGPALFATQADMPGLYTLRIDNHPSERGHAVIGDAVVAAIKERIKL
jgi:hypothetical protein